MLQEQSSSHLDRETQVTTVGPFTKEWIQSSPGRWRKRYDRLRPYWQDFKMSRLGKQKKTDLEIINKETLIKFRLDDNNEPSSENSSTSINSAEPGTILQCVADEPEHLKTPTISQSCGTYDEPVAVYNLKSASKHKAKRSPTLQRRLKNSDRILTRLDPINLAPPGPQPQSILMKNKPDAVKSRLGKKVVMFNSNLKSHKNKRHNKTDNANESTVDIDFNTFVNTNSTRNTVAISPEAKSFLSTDNNRSIEKEPTTNSSSEKVPALSEVESFVTAPEYPDSTHPVGVDIDPWSSDDENQETERPDNIPKQNLRSMLSRQSLQLKLLEENRASVAESIRHPKSISSTHPQQPRIHEMNTSLKKLLDGKQAGEIIAAEKMLVLLKGTKLKYVSHQFGEIENIETRVLEKWKEYIVVARNTSNPSAPILLQFYKNRDIPKIQENITNNVSKLDTILTKDTFVKFYSTLDKTIVFWRGSETGSLLYILRARSHKLSLRWLSLFLRTLGAEKSAHISIGIPFLGYSMEVTLPISIIQEEQDRVKREREMNNLLCYHEIMSLSNRASPVLKYLYAVTLKLLKNVGYTKEDIKKLLSDRIFGLAWRQYDRIEWMDGSNEEGLYYNWVLVDAYELEIRAKQPFAQSVMFENGTTMEEPVPIEGFLVRLTNWAGKVKKYKSHIGELFFKPLFFHTHDQFLFFSKTKNVIPGNPLGHEFDNFLDKDDEAKAARAPLIYEIRPFQTDSSGEIVWLKGQTSSYTARKYDENGFYEIQRRGMLLANSNGYIDLCEVHAIQPFSQAIIPFTIFNTSKARTQPINKDQIIEIIMKSGPTILLQAYNKETRDLWIERLSQLSTYWKRRIFEVTARINGAREHNLTHLNAVTDYEIDTFLGSRGNKWESTTLDSMADENLFCKTARSITIQGRLFQKPKKFASFRQYQVILSNGKLLLYNLTNSLYNNGVCHTKLMTVDLANSSTYVYSGPVTESDLLQGRDRSFDSKNPGAHYIPRVYADGWRSSEPEEHRCFVLWFGRKKPLKIKRSQFKQGIDTKELDDNADGDKDGDAEGKNNGIDLDIKFVNRLGVTGVSMVFLARSRQERDLWVLALNTEIERIAESATSDIQLH